MLRAALACVLIGFIPGIAAAACGPIPSSYPVLSGDKLGVGKDSTVNNGTATSGINGGSKYEGNLDAINASNGSVVSASPSYPSLDPATFPSTGSTDTSAAIVAAGSYDDITVAQSTTTTFTGGTYYIDKLVVGKSATVNLAAGRYFIDQLSLGDGAKIVVSSGPVQLYIGSEVVGDDTLSFNAAGTVADFRVFLYPGADWKVDKDAIFVGVIYAPGTSSDIEFDDGSSIRGALVTAGEVKLGQDTSLYFTAADQAAVGGVGTCAATTAAPSGFNAFETGTAAGSVSGVIRTKIAASAFGLDVVALKSSGTAIETAFAGDVKLELVDASAGAGCGAYAQISDLGLLTFTTTDLGRKTVSGISEPNAWPNARIRMTYPATGTPTVVACSTDNFAIRPASFGGVTVSDADSVTAGTARVLDNTGASGGIVHKAGRPFTLAATAIPTTTTNYTGTPGAVLSACVDTGCPTTLGTFSVGSAAVSGVINSTTASYSEVGAFIMQLQDQTFASVDVGDTVGDCSATGRYVCSADINVGRFVPDHFDLTIPSAAASAPKFKTFNDTTCATRSFTYVGQPFGYLTLPQATITAKNAAGATTLNYAGTLWKLAPAGATQTYTAVTGTLDAGLVGTPVVAETGSGAGTLTANAADVIAFARSTPIMPFIADITLSMSIQDTAENGVPGNGIIDTTTPAVFSSIAFDSGNEIRFGRLVLSNAHGSELLGLPVPIEAQFWTGSGFTLSTAVNAADFCTQLVATNVVLSNWQPDLNACETSVTLFGRFNAGRGNLRFSAPGANNTGSVDLALQLGAAAGGSTCVAGVVTAATAASQTWLQGPWSGGAYDQNPVARASFGLHRGSKPLIYLREMY
jgi:MSHA biogenesis protein MshQ